MDHETALELIAQFHEFYSSAWQELLFFGGIVAALFGVVLPVAIQSYQKRLLKDEKSDLKDSLDNQIERAKEDLRSEIHTEVKNITAESSSKMSEKLEHDIQHYKEEIRKEVNTEIEKLRTLAYKSQGFAFHLQYFKAKDQGSELAALQSAASAASYYAEADDGSNLRKIMSHAVESEISNVTKEDINADESTKNALFHMCYSIENSKYHDMFKSTTAYAKKLIDQ